MTETAVVVVGAGFSGTAAAWALRRRGLRVRVLSDGFGASRLYGGVVDAEADLARGGEPALREFEEALGIWHPGPCHVATSQGIVRRVDRADLALLTLDSLAGRTLFVADIARDDWDADLLAATLGASEWARASKTDFVAVPVTGLKHGYERRIPSYDFAALHDEPARLAWLGTELRRARPGAAGWLLGPWLGAERARARALSEIAGCVTGECTSPPGAASGARFDAARDALFRALGVTVEPGRVERVEPGSPACVHFRSPEGKTSLVRATAVILATGGVAGGGFGLVPRDSQHALGPFRASIEGPWKLTLGNEIAESEASLFGLDFTRRGFGILERVGFSTDSQGLLAEGVYAVGHARARVPRGGLDAVLSGLATARELAPALETPA